MSARLSPRINLSDPVKTPAPRWVGWIFDCDKCTGRYQLEAADKCSEIRPGAVLVTCPNCGFVNIAKKPKTRRKKLRKRGRKRN